jgi:diaminopimelate decarboxylase
MRLSSDDARALVAAHSSPLYVYSKEQFSNRARQLMELSLPYGLTVRYAMKANPHPDIIHDFAALGLHFDASSSYEAALLLNLGVTGESISLSSQQPAHNLEQLLQAGVRYVATSLHQLTLYLQVAAPGSHVALRINPGLGSGHNNRTTTGGISSSFGIWHSYLDEALQLAQQHGVVVDRLHVHIGSGADPLIWGTAIDTALELAERMPDVSTLDMGGGFKVRRVPGEAETDMSAISAVFAEKLTAFAERTDRRLHLEIEPGTWLVAHAGCLLSEIVDIVDTGKDGFAFLRINTGMNDFLRPTLYGAQHDIRVLSMETEQREYVVVGHNCESGDILTTAPHEPEIIKPRQLNLAHIGDLVAIADTGAYCASMRAIGYNAYPPANEVVI